MEIRHFLYPLPNTLNPKNACTKLDSHLVQWPGVTIKSHITSLKQNVD